MSLSYTQQNDNHKLIATYDHHLLCLACKEVYQQSKYKAPDTHGLREPPPQTHIILTFVVGSFGLGAIHLTEDSILVPNYDIRCKCC